MNSYRISDEKFDEIRAEVLQTWPTGKDIDFEEAVAYQKAIPESKNFAVAMRKASEKGITLCQPRAGVALIQDHIKLLQYLENEYTGSYM